MFRENMILLHVVLLALYAWGTWASWPAATSAGGSAAPRGAPSWAYWVVPIALVLHGAIAARETATPEGLDLSFGNALSVVAGLAAVIAWVSGLMRTLPIIATVVLPIAGVFSFLPLLSSNPHRFAFADAPLAALHVAVALIAYSLFIVAALQALVLMGLEKRLHRGLPADPGSEVPPLLTLERFLFRLVTLGFILLTITVVSGALFSEAIFGRPLTFSHKSVFSILSWLVFGGLLLGRRRYGWRGKVALRWILTGTTLLFLAYLGSKFVLEVLLGR